MVSKIFLGNDKGQLLTLDLLLSLVPLVLVLGISANAMSGVTTQIQDYIYGYDMQRVVDDAAYILVKTPGKPGNWTGNSSPNILGLSQFEVDFVNDVKTYRS